jgi:hypothetical protein
MCSYNWSSDRLVSVHPVLDSCTDEDVVNRDEYWKQVEEQQQELKENLVLYESGAISPEELVRRNNEVADRIDINAVCNDDEMGA